MLFLDVCPLCRSCTTLQAVATGVGSPSPSIRLITDVRMDALGPDAREVFFVKQRPEVVTGDNITTVRGGLR